MVWKKCWKTDTIANNKQLKLAQKLALVSVMFSLFTQHFAVDSYPHRRAWIACQETFTDAREQPPSEKKKKALPIDASNPSRPC